MARAPDRPRLAQLPPLQIPPPPGLPQGQVMAVHVVQPPTMAQQRANHTDSHLMCPSNFKVLTDLQGKSTCVTVLSPHGPWIQLPKEFVASVCQATESVPVGEMVLKRHQLRCLPHNFHQLESITILDLSSNCLEALPDVLCDLKQLQQLYLQHNLITSVPDCVVSLSNLKALHLQYNKLTVVPAGVCGCLSLELLNLENNQIESLSEEIGELRNLKKLQVTSNTLKCLPVSINNLHHLQELYLAKNNIQQLHKISGLTSLKQLHLAYNQLQFLPPCIINMSQLEGLTLTGNQMRFPPLSACRNGVKGIRQYMQDKMQGSIVEYEQGDFIITNLYYTGSDYELKPDGGNISPTEEPD